MQVKGTWYVADYNNFNVPTTLTATSTPPRPAECGTVARAARVSTSTSRAARAVRRTSRCVPFSSLFLSGAVSYDDDRQQSGLAGDGDGRDEAAHQPRAVAEADASRHVVVADARRLDGDVASRGAHDDAAGRVARAVHASSTRTCSAKCAGSPRFRVGREYRRQAVSGESLGRGHGGRSVDRLAVCRGRSASAWRRIASSIRLLLSHTPCNEIVWQ